MIIAQTHFEDSVKKLIVSYNSPKFLVAVSGGADSLCLCFMLKAFADKLQGKVLAAIVDHKIRDESTAEALEVSKKLRRYGIESIILTIDNHIGTHRIQSKARHERYSLLKKYAKEQGYPYLFLGHHLDDQIETMLIRESMGVNLVGDSGMSSKLVCQEVITLRPLLNYTKEDILETIKYYTNSWVEDPSNINTCYKRVYYRKEIEKLSYHDKQSLVYRLKYNITKRQKIEQELLDLFVKVVLINKWGLIKINLRLFNYYEENIKVLALRRLIRFSNGKEYELKISKILRFLRHMEGNKSSKFTLGNCILKVKQGFVYIFKNKILEGQDLIFLKEEGFWWDRRFLIKLNGQKDLISNITKSIFYNIIVKDKFKEFCQLYEMDGDFIWGLPFIYYHKESPKWSFDSYEGILYKSSSSIFMNFFISY